MRYFSMPADFNRETIDKFDRLNRTYEQSRVVETYGNITLGSNFGSGRVISQLPRIDLLDLKEYIDYSREKNIGFSYTLNAPFMQNLEFTPGGVKKIKKLLKNLHQIGVRSVTVALPSLIELVKSTGLDFQVKASTICHITNANKAAAYKRMGVDKIVVDESIHRDFVTLRRVRKVFGDQVEMIVNTMCHKNCAYRHFHYNETGGDSTGVANEVGVNFFEHQCMLQRYAVIGELLKLAWIRPEDLGYYTRIGIHYFKLQGRQHVESGDPLRSLECYMKGSYEGNLMELLDMFNTRYSFKVFIDNKKLAGFLKPYFETDHFCKNDCTACSYCETFARKCIDKKAALEITAAAREFYSRCDQYRRLLYSGTPPETGTDAEDGEGERAAETGPHPIEIDFQLD